MSSCTADNDYDGRMGVRISAIFVIGVCSLFATWFPVFAARHRGVGVPDWAFFIAKYFGSGVIIATAFIHLLAPANDALTDPCLTGPITEYDWVEGIVLMTIFVLFFVELMTMRYAKFGHSHEHDDLEPQDELGIKPEPFTDGKKPEIHDHADPAYEMPGRVSTSTAHCPTT
ncbi:ZIP zinc/iron transport family, partial [Aureobasidium melanogenum]